MEVSFLTWQFFQSISFGSGSLQGSQPPPGACRIGPLLKGPLDLFQAFFAMPWEESKQNGPPKKTGKRWENIIFSS